MTPGFAVDVELRRDGGTPWIVAVLERPSIGARDQG
jgi:hypothetical protein